MLVEARQAPAAVADQLAADAAAYEALGAHLREQPPTGVLTIARGSSDHAAGFMAYLTMARLGQLVTSLPMSLVTLYRPRFAARGMLSVAFSQSGQSPDLVAPTQYFRAQAARTVAFVNDAQSPLAGAAEWIFALRAGAETSVAATKSFIAQMVAGARLVGAWEGDKSFRAALADLPQALQRAVDADWQAAVEALRDADRLFVISRGTGLPVALEAALKFKEVCGLQAEAFSSAELRHGPMALIGAGYPMLIFAPRGPAQAGLLALADEMRARGARVLLAAPAGTSGCVLPLAEAAVADLDPVCAVQSFYPMVEALARARGFDPDRPPHLAKVTRTR
ncbi:SIS domain-containing protein [Verminephrobacter aporrectodeae subsp. tuberculatae]|uniref:SIS domain-containing protein n=1 Tax=Verminephrobacter aporrectodeae TaxID=1110389 RepID=UPI0022371312|nr:SIS domain-containing protein [Verminephrobacter aporrectodeae]MCW5258153.1 SIS domain-containing protein [Verminephrobacter aporrectodeae subsp. tuberculatae]